MEAIFGKVDLFVHLLKAKETIILCGFNFNLKKKKHPPTPMKKSCGGQRNNIIYLRLKNNSDSIEYALHVFKKMSYCIFPLNRSICTALPIYSQQLQACCHHM